MDLKPIETVYDGYRFRSRLEARWAVFFKTLGIPYEYEKEGFDLGDGVYYLPDFWLPKQKCWVEIKGQWPSDEELMKTLKLQNNSGKKVYLSVGPVCIPLKPPKHFSGCEEDQGWIQDHDDFHKNNNEWYSYTDGWVRDDFWGLFITQTDSTKKHGWDKQIKWSRCSVCGEVELEQWGVLSLKHYVDCENSLEDDGLLYDEDSILDAYAAARQARFERWDNN